MREKSFLTLPTNNFPGSTPAGLTVGAYVLVRTYVPIIYVFISNYPLPHLLNCKTPIESHGKSKYCIQNRYQATEKNSSAWRNGTKERTKTYSYVAGPTNRAALAMELSHNNACINNVSNSCLATQHGCTSSILVYVRT